MDLHCNYVIRARSIIWPSAVNQMCFDWLSVIGIPLYVLWFYGNVFIHFCHFTVRDSEIHRFFSFVIAQLSWYGCTLSSSLLSSFYCLHQQIKYNLLPKAICDLSVQISVTGALCRYKLEM